MVVGMGTTLPRRVCAAVLAISSFIGLAIAVWLALVAVQSGIWTAGHALEVLIPIGLVTVGAAVVIYVWFDRHGILTE